jgi:hypothetical protein
MAAGHIESDPQLAGLLALNEDIIEQLRRERLEGVGAVEYLLGMIDQHERAAAMLRSQLNARSGKPLIHARTASPLHSAR